MNNFAKFFLNEDWKSVKAAPRVSVLADEEDCLPERQVFRAPETGILRRRNHKIRLEHVERVEGDIRPGENRWI